MSHYKIASWHFLISVFCSPTVCGGAWHLRHSPSETASWNLDHIFQYFALLCLVFIVGVFVFEAQPMNSNLPLFHKVVVLSEIFDMNLTWYLKLNVCLISKQVFSNTGIPCRVDWIELRITLKFDLFLAKIKLWTSRIIFRTAWGNLSARGTEENFRVIIRYFSSLWFFTTELNFFTGLK